MTEGTRTFPLRGVRGMIADAMVKSLATAAQLTHQGSADATQLLSGKARLADAGTKTSVEDLLMRAVLRPHVGLRLTFDHRALDGAPAGNLLTSICHEIEELTV